MKRGKGGVMKMKWNLKVVMAERDIPSATELMRRLDDIGIKLSTAQASRIVKEMPSRLSTTILRGLLEVLHCEPNDLIVVEHDGEPYKPIKKRTIQPEKETATKTSDPISLTGPQVRTFPIKKD